MPEPTDHASHVHGPDCHHDHAPHVHGPDCHHDHAPHVHGPDCHHDHPVKPPYRRSEPKLGRNDPCHCGSGKKYKKCHGGAG